MQYPSASHMPAAAASAKAMCMKASAAGRVEPHICGDCGAPTSVWHGLPSSERGMRQSGHTLYMVVIGVIAFWLSLFRRA